MKSQIPVYKPNQKFDQLKQSQAYKHSQEIVHDIIHQVLYGSS